VSDAWWSIDRAQDRGRQEKSERRSASRRENQREGREPLQPIESHVLWLYGDMRADGKAQKTPEEHGRLAAERGRESHGAARKRWRKTGETRAKQGARPYGSHGDGVATSRENMEETWAELASGGTGRRGKGRGKAQEEAGPREMRSTTRGRR
jgi:hypothetical protein